MKAIQRIRQGAAWGFSALILSTVLLCAVACTGGSTSVPDGTTGGTAVTTAPATGHGGTETNRPLNPDAGTVAPGGDAGDPPTGTDGGGTTRSHRSDFMH